MNDLSKMTPAQLEAEANKLLYGDTKVPRRLRGTQYQMPKCTPEALGLKDQDIIDFYVCGDCGKPRSYSSGQYCLACYQKRAAKKRDAEDDKSYKHEILANTDIAFENGDPVPIYNDIEDVEI